MNISNRKLIVLLIVILVLCTAARCLFRPSGTQVHVTVDGRVYGTYDLSREQTVTVGPEDGSWYNILSISGGRAAVVESDCSNQICVHTPPLTEDTIGIIVCLPHGLVVELRE